VKKNREKKNIGTTSKDQFYFYRQREEDIEKGAREKRKIMNRMVNQRGEGGGRKNVVVSGHAVFYLLKEGNVLANKRGNNDWRCQLKRVGRAFVAQCRRTSFCGT